MDEETGLYFYRAWYYDPVKGRFLQRDPLGYVDGMNLYEYVRSNPANASDPYGEEDKQEPKKEDKPKPAPKPVTISVSLYEERDDPYDNEKSGDYGIDVRRGTDAAGLRKKLEETFARIKKNSDVHPICVTIIIKGHGDSGSILLGTNGKKQSLLNKR